MFHVKKAIQLAVLLWHVGELIHEPFSLDVGAQIDITEIGLNVFSFMAEYDRHVYTSTSVSVGNNVLSIGERTQLFNVCYVW